MRFKKVSTNEGIETVLFQFLNLDYGRAPGAAIEPEAITYRGQKGFSFNGNVAFIVPIVLNQAYSLSASDFTWPAYAFTDESGSHSGSWLSFQGFENDTVRVLVKDTEDPESAKVPSMRRFFGKEHFVAPKNSSAMVLHADLVRTALHMAGDLPISLPSEVLELNSAFSWEFRPEAGQVESAVSADLNKLTYNTSQPGTVRLTTEHWGQYSLILKANGSPVWTGYVWIVWAEPFDNTFPSVYPADQDPTTDSDHSLATFKFYVGWGGGQDLTEFMKWKVRPDALWSEEDVPQGFRAFGMFEKANVPGGPHWFEAGKDTRNGALYTIDASRRTKVWFKIPTHISPNNLFVDIGAAFNNMSEQDKQLYATGHVLINFPTNAVEGNDDANSETESATLDPFGNLIDGILRKSDQVTFVVRNSGGNVGDKVECDYDMDEFVRLKLGPHWYLISDYLGWYVHLSATKNYNDWTWANDDRSGRGHRHD
jgi:hypothetical protein